MFSFSFLRKSNLKILSSLFEFADIFYVFLERTASILLVHIAQTSRSNRGIACNFYKDSSRFDEEHRASLIKNIDLTVLAFVSRSTSSG